MDQYEAVMRQFNQCDRGPKMRVFGVDDECEQVGIEKETSGTMRQP